jgi:hypothetical protein
VMPGAFPQPVEEAPAKYVRVFLRALGVDSALRRVDQGRAVVGD